MGTVQGSWLEVFSKNALALRKAHVKRVLLLYEEKINRIGDFCLWAGKMRHFRTFYNNAAVDMNFSKKGSDIVYRSLLKNNPFVNQVFNLEWEELNFDNYDMIWIAAADESPFVAFLQNKFTHLFKEGQFKLPVFSFSLFFLGPAYSLPAIFPVAEDATGFIKTSAPAELYLSAEEVAWGNGLLKSKGLKDHEQIFILLDSTSRNLKLLNIHVYFELLTFLLQIPDSKVLIFDPENVGKASFYEAWLDAELFDRIIFLNGLELRKALAILAVPAMKLLLGPCTGLMHCASAIYNYYVRNGMPVGDVPLMITYTGQYPEEEFNAWFWWGDSPLTNCIMLKGTAKQKRIRLLTDLTVEERGLNDSLACSEYTADMLIGYLSTKLKIGIPVPEKI